MASAATERLGAPPAPRRGFTSHGVFGMALFVFSEVMLFTAFISAFLIVRGGTAPGAWPPAGQPRLPFAQTAVHTLALLASGVALWLAARSGGRRATVASGGPMLAALALGAYFVAAQGVEWAALLREGLTLTSSQAGAFFYVIVGAHALHALAALAALALCWARLRAGRLTPGVFGATRLFWNFVVLMWPVLYLVVYR
ncbi:MAG: heme-copper oxidase subunit III [Candidatus Eisenbacteria bacterium]|nr:heme-copper oxidase subunit III [Candidatus Eisenbacteria bacterium]